MPRSDSRLFRGLSVRRFFRLWSDARAVFVIALVAITLLALTALPLFDNPSGSIIGQLVTSLYRPARTTNLQFDAVQEIIGPDLVPVERSPDDVSHWQPADGTVLLVVTQVWNGRTGVWAPTSFRRTISFDFVASGTVSADQLDKAHSQIASRVAEWGGHVTTTDVASGTRTITLSRPIWFGYAHNVASLLLLVALIFSFHRFGSLVRRHFRIAADMCPRCRYSRVGFFDDVPCPECGEFGPGQRVRDLDRPID